VEVIGCPHGAVGAGAADGEALRTFGEQEEKRAPAVAEASFGIEDAVGARDRAFAKRLPTQEAGAIMESCGPGSAVRPGGLRIIGKAALHQ